MRSLRSTALSVLAAILFTTSAAWSGEPTRTVAPSEPAPMALQKSAPAVNFLTPAVCKLDEPSVAASPVATTVFWCCEQRRCVKSTLGCPFPPAYLTQAACLDRCDP